MKDILNYQKLSKYSNLLILECKPYSRSEVQIF